MKKIILIIAVLFLSCKKKETVTESKVGNELEKGEYFTSYNKKQSSALQQKTDTLNLFYIDNQLNRVEIKVFNESFGGDTPSGYVRYGYHINKNNILDATVTINDTLEVNNGSDYPRKYEEYYNFYRNTYIFSYVSPDGKKLENYFKSTEDPSKGYFSSLLSLDIVLSKINFPLEKMPKSLYDIKNNKEDLYAGQDSLKVYETNDTGRFKVISSSIPFNYLRDIKIKKDGNSFKYFAKVSIKKEGLKYVDLKEIERIQVINPHLDEERFVTSSNGLELYDNSQESDCFGKEEFLIVKIPKGERVEMKGGSDDYFYIDGKKGSLVNVIYQDKEGETKEGIAFSGYLSINKP
ncbi:hypothetical protein JI750_07750 [Flavobacterium sp. GN10]|uniref:Lipoprotein n=1 Tax=Flavobacterium tagetis TaxID=2801336 RepID=A0ABS1KC46_9FLAO|nr:hypothetical protein [Flavobacterium tagetis]MBL0736772.1 hypothetical protein [Flavobacterium tagetis]